MSGSTGASEVRVAAGGDVEAAAAVADGGGGGGGGEGGIGDAGEPERRGAAWRVRFSAMASPCELLVDGGPREHARELGRIVAAEARRIETKYSRYLEGSVVQRINSAGGAPVELDAETVALLGFAAECHAASGGRFDVTSGVLREAWRFDGSERVPTRRAVAALLPRIGWHRASLRASPGGTHGGATFALPAGMQIDFGGIGKEYAVDRAVALAAGLASRPFLVNFGGDLAASGPPAGGAWHVGVERPGEAPWTLALRRGAVATSGDARRHVLRDGVRLGHVLDPRTGWPVADAPNSVTVLAPTCSAAGVLATLALLHGAGAEDFLAGQEIDGRAVRWRCERDGGFRSGGPGAGA